MLRRMAGRLKDGVLLDLDALLEVVLVDLVVALEVDGW